MRIRISHEITHRYAPPARMAIQNLRLTPHGFDSQYVLNWRIDLDLDSALRQSEDAHGNTVTTFSHHGAPLERLTVVAGGEIETSDAAGVVRGQSSGSRRRCTCARARSPASTGRCATSRRRRAPPIRSTPCTG